MRLMKCLQARNQVVLKHPVHCTAVRHHPSKVKGDVRLSCLVCASTCLQRQLLLCELRSSPHRSNSRRYYG